MILEFFCFSWYQNSTCKSIYQLNWFLGHIYLAHIRMCYMVEKCYESMENTEIWESAGPIQEKLLFLQFPFNTSNCVLKEVSV